MEATATGAGSGLGLAVRAAFVFVAVVSLLLGYWGLYDYVGTQTQYGDGVLDLLYWDLQLFVLGSVPLEEGGELPVALQIARFSAPAATAYALFATVRALLGHHITLALARYARGHTIICGASPAMLLLARQLVAEGRRVVLIDPGLVRGRVNATAGLVPHAGVLPIGGDARDGETLRQAGAHRAREVMALSSDSAFNTEVALAFRAIATSRRQEAVCYVQVDNRELCTEMAARALSVASPHVRLELFSRHDRAVRRLLDRHPLPTGTDTRRAAVLVVGGGPLARALVTELARRQSQGARRPDPPLAVRVIGDDPAATSLAGRLSLPADAVRLPSHEAPISSLREASQLWVGNSPPSHVFVCLDDEATAIAAGARASRLLADQDTQVVVAAANSTVFGRLLNDGTASPNSEQAQRGGPDRLILHNVIETVYTPEAVRQGDVDDIARAAHDDYVDSCRARGETPEVNSSMVPWDQLPDRLKDDNRAQAADIGRKLAAIGATIVPSFGHDEPLGLTDEEIERLARMEHERWMSRRRDLGWFYAMKRTDAAKRHPDMVGWNELSEASRDKDRTAVRAIPSQLHAAGFAIVRGSHRQG